MQSRGEGDASELNREINSVAREAADRWAGVVAQSNSRRGAGDPFVIVVDCTRLDAAVATAKRPTVGTHDFLTAREFSRDLRYPVSNIWHWAAAQEDFTREMSSRIAGYAEQYRPKRYFGPGPGLVVANSAEDLDASSILDRASASASEHRPNPHYDAFDPVRDGAIVVIGRHQGSRDQGSSEPVGPAGAKLAAAISTAALHAQPRQPGQLAPPAQRREPRRATHSRGRQPRPEGRSNGAAREGRG